MHEAHVNKGSYTSIRYRYLQPGNIYHNITISTISPVICIGYLHNGLVINIVCLHVLGREEGGGGSGRIGDRHKTKSPYPADITASLSVNYQKQ